ncbi:MAG: DUF624 domain-containing protein [Clostridium sp.]
MSEIFSLDKIFDTFNYIFWFFLLNLFFMVLNIPIVSFFIFVGISDIFSYLPLFLLCLIPIGPTITALLYCTGKLIRNKSINVFSDFLNGLKLNFVQATGFWCFELLIVFMLYSNIKFFSVVNYNLVLTCVFAALLILLLLVTPYIYILISRFSMKSMDIIKASFILAFTRPILTISNILVLIVSLILFEMSPGTIVLFVSSIITYLLSFTNKSLLSELESTPQNS